MLLSEFFANLSYGELSNLSIGSEGSGQIAPTDQPKIINYTNQALTRLYTRFSHKTDYVTLQLQEGMQRYALTPLHAVSNTDPANTEVRYLLDTAEEPFQDDFLKVVSIIQKAESSLEEDEELTLNDLGNPKSIRTLAYNKILVPFLDPGKLLELEYLVRHPKLVSTISADQQYIELSPVLYEALEYAVAARIMKNMGGEDAITRSQILYSEYEQICVSAETKDLLQNTSSSASGKFQKGGWG